MSALHTPGVVAVEFGGVAAVELGLDLFVGEGLAGGCVRVYLGAVLVAVGSVGE